MGKRTRYRDHIDPEHRRWGREYPRFPGVAECVRLIRDRKATGTWADIVVYELAQNATECLPEIIEAFRSDSDSKSDVRMYLMMALEIARVEQSIDFLIAVLKDGDARYAPYAERALTAIDSPISRTALSNAKYFSHVQD